MSKATAILAPELAHTQDFCWYGYAKVLLLKSQYKSKSVQKIGTAYLPVL
jgi:hypothetical protein